MPAPAAGTRKPPAAATLRNSRGSVNDSRTASGPGNRISAGSLDSRSESPFEETVLINRVEYADGSIWQRKDWNFGEIRAGYQRAVGTPWGPTEMCRGL